jgi:hypothetical protein|tara:strand:- start:236 stop:442 length:207 start_codon:yes stop_codon:yes gene_type:complete
MLKANRINNIKKIQYKNGIIDGSIKVLYVTFNDDANKFMSIPIREDNRYYAEIKRRVDAGELTIEDAD